MSATSAFVSLTLPCCTFAQSSHERAALCSLQREDAIHFLQVVLSTRNTPGSRAAHRAYPTSYSGIAFVSFISYPFHEAPPPRLSAPSLACA